MTWRAAVVGCGFIGASPVTPGSGAQSHAAAWARHPGVDLAALVDPSPGRLSDAAARWPGAVPFADTAAMLEAVRPEIVSVASPDETHADVLEQVLMAESVRAVLAEKPLALDSATAVRLTELAAARGVVLGVNYVRRYAPSHRLLAEWLRGSPIGAIELVRGAYVRGIKHNGTHWLDLVRWLVGEVDLIRGRGPADDSRDPTIDADLVFRCGARGTLHGAAGAPYSLFELDLIGTEGRVRVIDGGDRIETWRVERSRRFPGFRELVPAAGPTGGLADLLLHAAGDLVESLVTGRAPASTGEDAVAALRLAEEAIATARIEGGVDAAAGR